MQTSEEGNTTTDYVTVNPMGYNPAFQTKYDHGLTIVEATNYSQTLSLTQLYKFILGDVNQVKIHA